MPGHLSKSELEGYYRRQLPVDKLLAADEHLAACEVCYARFRGDDKLEELYSFAQGDLNDGEEPSRECIPVERLSTFVNDALGTRERDEIQTHLAMCEECAELVGDLRNLRSEIDWDRTLVPAEDSAAARSTQLTRFWTANKLISAAAAATLLVTFIAAGLIQKQVGDLRAQISQLQQANEDLQQNAADSQELREHVAGLEKEIEDLRLGPILREEIALNDAGRQVTLDTQGNLSGLDSLSSTDADLVREALTSGRVQVAAASLPAARPAHVRGNGESGTFKLRSPIGAAVLTERPTFRWEALPGAQHYVVFVRDLTSDVEFESEATTGLEWTPQQPLVRGRAYSWAVEALKDGRRIHAPGPHAPSAAFKILEKTRADELARLKRSSGGSHLLLGILYGKYGLAAEAESEIKILSKENPESKVVARLLKSVSSRRR
jgi:hypothetical protein